MATTTTNFNLTKPADTDPVDIVTLEGDNMDKIDTALQDNKTPTFSDYNSSDSGMPSESQALTNIKSKATLSTLFQNIKAYLKKACTVGQLVTNCTSSSNTLPLAASQGKVLQDQITTLNRNSTVNAYTISDGEVLDAFDLSIKPGLHPTGINTKNIPVMTYGQLMVTQNTDNNWRFLLFIPTDKSYLYLNFYNGYTGDKWGEWVKCLFS